MGLLRLTGTSCVLVVVLTGCEKKTLSIETTTIKVDSLSQVVLLQDSMVRPIIYSQLHGLGQEPIPKAKALFISAVLPAILIVKGELEQKRIQLRNLKEKENWTVEDSTFYHEIRTRYKASDLDNLLYRMETLPNSIVLAQAAVESGWGQSRFFLEGNNIFGMWSYNRDEPRLRAESHREQKAIHVRAYANLVESVRDYFETLGSAPAYRGLRKALQETDDPFELLPYLKYYSEGRMEYVKILKIIIVKNNFTQYDHYQIDPQYLIAE